MTQKQICQIHFWELMKLVWSLDIWQMSSWRLLICLANHFQLSKLLGFSCTICSRRTLIRLHGLSSALFPSFVPWFSYFCLVGICVFKSSPSTVVLACCWDQVLLDLRCTYGLYTTRINFHWACIDKHVSKRLQCKPGKLAVFYGHYGWERT